MVVFHGRGQYRTGQDRAGQDRTECGGLGGARSQRRRASVCVRVTPHCVPNSR